MVLINAASVAYQK